MQKMWMQTHITQLLGGAGTWDKLPAGQFVLVPDMCVCACVSPKFVGINYSFTIGCGQSQGSPLLELFLFSNKDCKLAVPHCC